MNTPMPLNQAHLNENQIDDVLIGDATTNTSAHLEACTDCRERVAIAMQPMESFAALTLAWSERQSATMAAQPGQTNATTSPQRWSWALGAAVLLIAGLLLPLSRRDTHSGNNLAATTASPATTASVTAPQPTPVIASVATPRATLRTVSAERTSSAEVTRDNQMLAAIHEELDASMQSPVDAFNLPTTTNRAGGGHGQNVPAPTLD